MGVNDRIFDLMLPTRWDVAGPLDDIRIDGRTSHRPHARYLLLWVRISRPNLATLLLDAVEGRPVRPAVLLPTELVVRQSA